MKERTASFYIGDDQWHCTNYAVTDIKIFEKEPETLIRKAYDAWMKACGGGLPDNKEFDADHFVHHGNASHVSRVETTSELQDFRVFDYGPERVTARPLDLQDPIQRRGLLLELLECIETRQPIYQEVRMTVRGTENHHWRLLLPVIDERASVVNIYIVRRPVMANGRQPIDFEAIIR